MSEHPVVACYGGIDSVDAVQLGAQLAAALHQPLVLARAYAYDPVSLSARTTPSRDNGRRAAAARAAVRRARAFAGQDVEIRERIVPSAGIADALVDLAVDVDACLLVVGRDTDGHVTRALLPRSPCPVLVAPQGSAIGRRVAIVRMGVAYDGSPASRLALAAAAALARATDAELVVIAAAPTSEHAATRLQIARLSWDPGIAIETRALAGDTRKLLVEESAALDLLVCGSRGRGRAAGALLGSVSAHLAAHAQCPLLVISPAVELAATAPLGVTSGAT